MVSHATDTEHILVQKTAEEYRNRGYEVFLEAPLDFLPGFRVDLIAKNADEVKVIEVKARRSLAANPRISELARIIESKPGWSFELLFVDEPGKLHSPDDARPFKNADIVMRIDQAEKLLELGYTEAAFMLAWSAYEGTARELIATEGVLDTGITASGYVFDQAIFRGLISREEHNTLTEMRKYRNAIVHGYITDDFSGELVIELIETIRRIATSTEPDDSGDLHGH